MNYKEILISILIIIVIMFILDMVKENFNDITTQSSNVLTQPAIYKDVREMKSYLDVNNNIILAQSYIDDENKILNNINIYINKITDYKFNNKSLEDVDSHFKLINFYQLKINNFDMKNKNAYNDSEELLLNIKYIARKANQLYINIQNEYYNEYYNLLPKK